MLLMGLEPSILNRYNGLQSAEDTELGQSKRLFRLMIWHRTEYKHDLHNKGTYAESVEDGKHMLTPEVLDPSDKQISHIVITRESALAM
jgi:hypothetical protein